MTNSALLRIAEENKISAGAVNALFEEAKKQAVKERKHPGTPAFHSRVFEITREKAREVGRINLNEVIPAPAPAADNLPIVEEQEEKPSKANRK